MSIHLAMRPVRRMVQCEGIVSLAMPCFVFYLQGYMKVWDKWLNMTTVWPQTKSRPQWPIFHWFCGFLYIKKWRLPGVSVPHWALALVFMLLRRIIQQVIAKCLMLEWRLLFLHFSNYLPWSIFLTSFLACFWVIIWNKLMILCRFIQQVNAKCLMLEWKLFFFIFLIISPDPFLIAAAVGKPGFHGISTFLVWKLFWSNK